MRECKPAVQWYMYVTLCLYEMFSKYMYTNVNMWKSVKLHCVLFTGIYEVQIHTLSVLKMGNDVRSGAGSHVNVSSPVTESTCKYCHRNNI